MQKSLIYCRVSSQRQKIEGHGLESQEHRCQQLADQKGYEVEKVFRDSFTGKGDFFARPAMAELLRYLDAHPRDSYVVIFDDLKRFARDVVFHWKLKQEFSSRGIKLECLNFTFEDTPEGRFIETIMAGQGQLEREQNRRQVLQKMKARLEAGYWCFPDLPEGYEFIKSPVHGKLPVLVQPKAAIVKEALESFASGRLMEQEDVRKFLEQKDIRDGKPVYLDYVKRMLMRIFYTGYIEYPLWEVSRRQARHEALIDSATYDRIQERLNGKTTTHTKNYLNPDFPLRSFVLCSTCKQPMTASWSTGSNAKFAYYRCKTKGCIERNKSVAKGVIEGEFESILGKINPSSEVLNLTKAIIADVWQKKIANRVNEKKEIEQKIQRLISEKEKLVGLALRAADDGVRMAYEEKISEIVGISRVLNNSLESFDRHVPNVETALNIVFDFLKNPLKQWQKGNIHTKKLVLRLVFEQNLAYSRKTGFETAILSLPLRVFGLPEAQKSMLVEMRGIEPRCRRDSMDDSTACSCL